MRRKQEAITITKVREERDTGRTVRRRMGEEEEGGQINRRESC